MFKNNTIHEVGKNKDICFIVLGHEINKENYELSYSGKERCKLLFRLINANKNSNYFVIFMGLGRKEIMADCNLSISECMLNYFNKKYFCIKDYYIDKNSLDSVGDAIYSMALLREINFNKKIILITSDWHIKRIEKIFKSIYGNRYILSFSETKEIEFKSKNELYQINKNEKKSLNIFHDTFKNYHYKSDDPISFLIKNHPLYRK